MLRHRLSGKRASQRPDREREIAALLDRPVEQRVREYRFRFGQSVVFGTPVLFLEWLGPGLGGPDAQRWVPVFQAVLAGWVTYVAAGGMLSDGALRLLSRSGVSGDFVVATVGALAYIVSAVATLGVALHGSPLFQPLLFAATVFLMIVWTGGRCVYPPRPRMPSAEARSCGEVRRNPTHPRLEKHV